MAQKEYAEVPALVQPYQDDVYEPSDDTFLFLDALLDQQEYLQTEVQPSICCEVGCGSGAVFNYLAKAFPQAYYLATDLNPLAAHAAYLTAQSNQVPVFDVVQMDLMSAVSTRLQGQIDVLMFNPPYVVTDSFEVNDGKQLAGIEAAWAGGKDGREVLDRLLPQIPQLLSARGVFYLVTIEENKPKSIAKYLNKFGFEMQTIRKKKAFNERLAIQRFRRVE